MDTTTMTALLRSFASHVDQHPALADGLSNVSIGTQHDDVEIHALVFDHTRGHMSELAEWVRTLTDTTKVMIQTDTGHMHLVGRTSDGTQVQVRTVLDDREIDLLAAEQTVVKRGETFPVEMLLRLAAPTRVPVEQRDAAAQAATTDKLIDDTPLASSEPSLPIQLMWAEAGIAVLGAFLRDTRAGQDKPINPAHTAQLEQAIGRPIPVTDLIGGGA